MLSGDPGMGCPWWVEDSFSMKNSELVGFYNTKRLNMYPGTE